jgi:hypothetical protein
MPARHYVLFAEREQRVSRRLVFLAQGVGAIGVCCATAKEAQRALVATSPSLLFANVRFGAMKGVDLVHLAKMANRRVRAVLYGGPHDLLLAREAQRAGGFFEPAGFLPYALTQYLTATLPASDRRNALRVDRRHTFRGGRRATDIEALFRPPR